MPFTPSVERPIGRSASSVAVKRSDMPVPADEQDVVVLVDEQALDTTSSSSRSLIAMTPPWRLVSYSVRRVFLTRPSRVASTRYGRDAVVADVEDLRDLLVGLQRQQVRDVLALGVAAGLWHLVRLRRGRPGPWS